MYPHKASLYSETAVREGQSRGEGERMWVLGHDLRRSHSLLPSVVAVEMYSAAKVATEPAVWELLWAPALSHVHRSCAFTSPDGRHLFLCQHPELVVTEQWSKCYAPT